MLRNNRNKWYLTILGVLAAVILAACATPTSTTVVEKVVVTETPQTEPVQVVVIHIGPVMDFGWTYAHDQGVRKASLLRGHLFVDVGSGQWHEITADTLEENIIAAPHYKVVNGGGAVVLEIHTVEGVGPEDFYSVAKRSIREYGPKLLIATAENYRDDINILAQEFPATNFAVIHGDYKPTLPNVASYFGKIYEAWYVAGWVAGRLSKTGIATFVGAYEGNGQVETNIAGFARGFFAGYEGPQNPKISVIYTGTWYDEVRERQAAEGHLPDSDVIAAHQDTPSVGKVGLEDGLWVFGYDSDWGRRLKEEFGNADKVVTSCVWDWSLLYTKFIAGAIEEKFPSGRHWPGLGSGLVDLAPWSPLVPAEVVGEAEALKAKIVTGEFKVFPHLTDDEIWGLVSWKEAQD